MFNNSIKLFIILLILISCNVFIAQNNEDLPLTETNWELFSFNYIFQGPIQAKSGEYTILFSDTGTVQSKVDCNLCFGDYTLGNRKTISIHLEGCTKVGCGKDSKDSDFHDAVKNTTKYSIEGNDLRLYFDNNFLHFINRLF